MKILMCAALVLSSIANAQPIECPKLFPAKDTALPELAPGNVGKVRVRQAHLSFAYMYFGDLFGEQTLVGPEAKKVKGGWDSEYGFSPQDTNWLICRYGGSSWGSGDIELWQKVPPNVTSCVLKVRQVSEPHSPAGWTAKAICK